MMNRKHRTVGVMSAIALGGMLISAGALTGCSTEEEEPVVQQRTAPPPAPEPEQQQTVRPVDELKAEMRIDDRVLMTEDAAPATTDERRAILSFFDAFVRGDHRAVGRMMTDLDRRELDRMVESGQWDEATGGINEVLIYQTGESPENGPAVVALFATRDGDQAQLWYYTGSGDSFMFEAAPTPPNMASNLSGTDWITAWHEVLKEEMELAMQTDDQFSAPESEPDEPRGGGRSGGGSSPGGGPGLVPPGGPSPPSGPRPPRRAPPSGPGP